VEDLEPATKLSKDGSIHATDERINTITSLFGTCLSVLGMALLVVQSAAAHKPWHIVAFSIYGLSLVALFTFSTLHHAVSSTPKVEARLRMLDYVSVFGLIAGTSTPIVLVLDRTPYGWAVLGSIYALALTGGLLRGFKHDLPRHITNTLYIVVGWLPAVLVGALVHVSIGAAALVVAGGIIFSSGFVIYAIEKPTFRANKIFGFHELWHCLVILAAACYYLFMYWYVLPRP
jgi:hemolysin III